MSTVDPGTIDLFRYAKDLPAPLWDDLKARNPEEAALASGATWDGRGFFINLLGRCYRVEPEARQVVETGRPEHLVSYQAGLVLIKALAGAKDVLPGGNMVTPRELPGGELFFNGPHAVNTPALEKAFGADPKLLLQRAEPLGGSPTDGGDVAVSLLGLPRIPLYVIVWGADEEFGARAVVGVDSRAVHHLALDGIWALTNLLISRLTVE